jgi:uncharacterized integral membrane protein (TIGR00697 family)
MNGNHRYLPFLAGLFTASLLISNTISSKVFTYGPVTLPAGIILIPFSYVFGDLLTEVYGYSASRKVIWSGVVALVLMVLSYLVADILTPADFWHHQRDFHEILAPVPRIALASVTALFVGEFTNSYVLAKMKVRYDGRYLPARYVASTVVGQAVDTIAFSSVAFVGIFPTVEILRLGLWGWGVKIAWELIALPGSLLLTKWLKEAEKVDFFDHYTNFNPFVLETDSKRSL